MDFSAAETPGKRSAVVDRRKLTHWHGSRLPSEARDFHLRMRRCADEGPVRDFYARTNVAADQQAFVPEIAITRRLKTSVARSMRRRSGPK